MSWILGTSGNYVGHDLSFSLVDEDGRLQFVAEEERFTRLKHQSGGLPSAIGLIEAMRAYGVRKADVATIATGADPDLLERESLRSGFRLTESSASATSRPGSGIAGCPSGPRYSRIRVGAGVMRRSAAAAPAPTWGWSGALTPFRRCWRRPGLPSRSSTIPLSTPPRGSPRAASSDGARAERVPAFNLQAERLGRLALAGKRAGLLITSDFLRQNATNSGPDAASGAVDNLARAAGGYVAFSDDVPAARAWLGDRRQPAAWVRLDTVGDWQRDEATQGVEAAFLLAETWFKHPDALRLLSRFAARHVPSYVLVQHKTMHDLHDVSTFAAMWQGGRQAAGGRPSYAPVPGDVRTRVDRTDDVRPADGWIA